MMNDNLYKILKLLEEGNFIFLTGGAGVGKSYISNKIISFYKKIDKNVVSLGSTGISAVNVGGFTIHSFFVLGICSDFTELKEHDRGNLSRIKELNKLLPKIDLIVIDEISMVSANMMDMILFRLRKGKFKGKILIVGDFFQLPPIFKNQDKKNLFESKFAFESDAWELLNPKIIELTTTKRTTDMEFSKILHKIRIGSLNDIVLDYLEELRQNKIAGTPTYLYGTNAMAKKRNMEQLSQLETKEISMDSELDMDSSVSITRVSNWLKSLPIEEELLLKEGAKVLFTKNRWGKYFNGERGTIISIEKNVIIVEKTNSKIVSVEREGFYLTKIKILRNKIKEIKLASLYQFPLKLSYAITIHKSQGMSIDNLICNVDNIFSESQFYVALSRATDPKNLKIDFSRYYFKNYLSSVIRVNQKVVDFYIKNNPLFLQ